MRLRSLTYDEAVLLPFFLGIEEMEILKNIVFFPFARSSSPKQKKNAWPQVKVCRLSQL